MVKTLMLCDCGKSQSLNVDAISNATGLKCSALHTGLCTTGLDTVAQILPEGDLIIACAQESEVFEDLAAELEVPAPLCVDIRDRAGWSSEGKSTTPKIAALLAEATLPTPAIKAMDVESEGLCLIIGHSDVALPAAEQLADVIDVTVLLSDAPDITPNGLDILSGHLHSASGALGRFKVTVNALRTLNPAGHGALKFGKPRDGGSSDSTSFWTCLVIPRYFRHPINETVICAPIPKTLWPWREKSLKPPKWRALLKNRYTFPTRNTCAPIRVQQNPVAINVWMFARPAR